MKLVHYELESTLCWEPLGTVVLTVENKPLFQRLIWQMYRQCKGQAGDWIATNDDEEVSLSKQAVCCINLFDLSDIQKKLQSKLVERLVDNAYQEDLYISTHTLLSQVHFFAQQLLDTVDADLEWGEPELTGIIKSLGIKWTSSDKLLDQLTQVINVASTLTNIKLFIFVGLQGYFTADEWETFDRHCALHDMCVLDVEPIQPKPIGDRTVLVIDNDLCEFVAKE